MTTGISVRAYGPTVASNLSGLTKTLAHHRFRVEWSVFGGFSAFEFSVQEQTLWAHGTHSVRMDTPRTAPSGG
jgi:hypothetical protein